MSVWVVVLLSMISGPDKHRIVLDAPTSLAFCEVAGQQTAAAWLDEHPKWQLDKVQCTPGNKPPSYSPDEI